MKRTLLVGFLVVLPFGVRAGDLICIEAESAEHIVAPARIMESTNAVGAEARKAVNDASEQKLVEIPRPKKPGGSTTNAPPCYDAKTGTNVIHLAFEADESTRYSLWCRVWWTDECGNSFFMSIDNGHIFTFGQDGVYKRWHWIKAPRRFKSIPLTKGKHSLRIKIRETGVRIDQILFVKDADYVPVGIE